MRREARAGGSKSTICNDDLVGVLSSIRRQASKKRIWVGEGKVGSFISGREKRALNHGSLHAVWSYQPPFPLPPWAIVQPNPCPCSPSAPHQLSPPPPGSQAPSESSHGNLEVEAPPPCLHCPHCPCTLFACRGSSIRDSPASPPCIPPTPPKLTPPVPSRVH